jgi:hypothetical protein
MPLTDLTIKNAKPAAKTYKVSDGGSLYIEISPAGSKLWRMKYRFDGKEKRLSFGKYPYVGLKDAREKREAARTQLVRPQGMQCTTLHYTTNAGLSKIAVYPPWSGYASRSVFVNDWVLFQTPGQFRGAIINVAVLEIKRYAARKPNRPRNRPP